MLIGQLEVPTQWDIRMLQTDLEQMGIELGFTVKLQHENIFVATNQLRLVPAQAAELCLRFLILRPSSPSFPMLRTDEILSTIQMLHDEHLDVRSVTLGLNLDDCAAPNLDHLCRKLRHKIVSRALAGWLRCATAWGPSSASP